MSKIKCNWPGCSAESERPFSDGWSAYAAAEGLVPGLPDQGFLCQRHGVAFEAVNAGPPTDREQ